MPDTCGCSKHLLSTRCVPDLYSCEQTQSSGSMHVGVIIQVRVMTGGKKLHGKGLTLPRWGECQRNLCLAEGHRATKGLVQGHQLGSGRAGCRPAT